MIDVAPEAIVVKSQKTGETILENDAFKKLKMSTAIEWKVEDLSKSTQDSVNESIGLKSLEQTTKRLSVKIIPIEYDLEPSYIGFIIDNTELIEG